MKTLKKTLCLVLAVVMVVGALVLPASAKDYGDKDSISKDYTAAVTDLTAWKVMKGDEQGNFKPADPIERQEMAAIAYRLLTGDVNVDAKTGKDNSGKYASYAAKFTDVPATGWAAGYIGFCVANGIVKGSSDTTFEPTRKINATDVLTILLRCMGCTNAFTGADYAQAVSKLATRLGLTAGITQDLGKESPREQVAQMTHNAALASRVTWSESEQDYIPYQDPNKPGSTKNISLIEFGEDTAATYTENTTWGYWTGTSTTKDVIFTYPVPNVKPVKVTSKTAKTSYWDYWEAVTECDVATDADIKETKTLIPVYLNGYKTDEVKDIDPLDQVQTIGAQGLHTYVTYNPGKAADGYRIVYVDTFLAVVTGIEKEVLDTNKHVIVPNTAILRIFGFNKAGEYITATGKIDNPDGTKYKKDDRVLLNIKLDDKDTEAGYLKANGEYYDETIAATVTGAAKKIITATPATTKPGVTVSGILSDYKGIKDTNNTKYYFNCNVPAGFPNEWIGEKVDLYLDSQGNIMDYELVTSNADYGVVTAAELVRVGTGKYAAEFEIFTKEKTTQTVRALKPVIENNRLTGYTYYVPGDSLPEDADFGTLVSFVPSSAYTGYYVVEKCNDPVALKTSTYNREVEAGNATILPGIVNDDTVFFIARYALNNKTDKYDFVRYDVVTGYKNIDVLAHDSVRNDDIDYEAWYVDADNEPTDLVWFDDEGKVGGQIPDNEYVVINGATKVTTQAAKTVYDYAYITDVKDYKTTESNQYVFKAFINGEETTLTVAANAVGSINGGGPGLYTYNAAKTTNGASTDFVKANDFRNYNRYRDSYGLHINDFARLENEPNYPIVSVNYDSGVLKVGNKDNNWFFSVAAGAKVWLVNNDGGKLTSVTTMSLVNNYKYTGCEMYAELDKNGDISVLYIVDNGIEDTPKPQPEATVGAVKYDLTYSKGIGLKDITTKKNIPVPADGKIVFTATTETEIYDIKVNVTNPAAKTTDPAVSYTAEVVRNDAGNDQYTYTITISALPTKSATKDDVKLNINLIALTGKEPQNAVVNGTNYTAPVGNSETPAPGLVDKQTWKAGSEMYKDLGITVKAGKKANEIIVEVDEDQLNKGTGENDPRRLIPEMGDVEATKLPTLKKGDIGYVGVAVGTSGHWITNITVGSNTVMDGDEVAIDLDGMYLEFYGATKWDGEKWVAKPGSYKVAYDSMTWDEVNNKAVVDQHFTWTITVKAAEKTPAVAG